MLRPDPRPYALERQALRERPDARSNQRPHQDPGLSSWLHRMDFGREPRLLFGRIVDAVAYAHMYKVQVERGGSILLCCDSAQGSFQLTGATPLHTYTVGSGVIILQHPQSPLGVILCALPDYMFDPTSALSDYIVQGSNVGLRSDWAHKFPFSLAAGGGLQDRSGGRPVDSLTVGEWGAMAETGLGVFIDPFIGFLRLDEETGLYVFYHGQKARLTGHNLELWSAGRHREEYDDQNELTGVDGWTPYVHEAHGLLNRGAAQTTRQVSAQASQVDTPWYSTLEPALDDQVPFHRRRTLRGYLGQGGSELLALPPANGTLSTRSGNRIDLGVYEQAVSLTGAVGIRSAKSVFIGKCTPALPVPKQLRRAPDPNGDRPATYRHAGLYGSGPPHLVLDNPQPSVSQPGSSRVAGVADLYDFMFNWQAWRHAFHYHTLDWYLPQESAMPSATAVAAAVPSYALLASQQYLPVPAGITMKVDERYGNVLYFPNNAFIALLEDGGIVFVDGWGSEYAMTGGSITESCAGDIWKLPGSNYNVWAGADAVVRANGSFEASANRGNVRLKAQQSVLMAAGVGGCGGFVFDCRAATGPSYKYDANNPVANGFLVRCSNSPVVLLGQDMLLSTRYPTQGNHLVIDSGTAKTIINGSFVEARAANAFVAVTGSQAHEFWADEVNLSADLSVAGKAIVTGCGMFGTSLAAPTVAGAVASYDATVSSTVTAAVNFVNTRHTALVAYCQSSATDVVDLVTRAADATKVQFEWRDASDYGTVGLALYEPRWHQVARLTAQSLSKWSEAPSVDDQGNVTYPHPGKASWLNGVSYAQQNLLVHSDVTGLALDRGALYETAVALPAPAFVNLENNFLVVTNP